MFFLFGPRLSILAKCEGGVRPWQEKENRPETPRAVRAEMAALAMVLPLVEVNLTKP